MVLKANTHCLSDYIFTTAVKTREERTYHFYFTDVQNEAQSGLHKATLLERETQITPNPTLFLPQAKMSLAGGVLRSREVLTLLGRGLEASESDTPVNFHPQ